MAVKLNSAELAKKNVKLRVRSMRKLKKKKRISKDRRIRQSRMLNINLTAEKQFLVIDARAPKDVISKRFG